MAVCPNCGAQNSVGVKFCTSCGGQLPVEAPVQQPQQYQQYQQAPQPQYQQPQQYQQQPQYQQPQYQPVQQSVPIEPAPQVPYQQVMATPIAPPTPVRGKAYAGPKTNGLCVAGLVLSIIGIFTFGLTSLLGLILSLAGLASSKKKKQAGKGKAIAGVIISSIILVIGIIYGSFFFVELKKEMDDMKIENFGVLFEDLWQDSQDYTGDKDKIIKDIISQDWVNANDESGLSFLTETSYRKYEDYTVEFDNYVYGDYEIYVGFEAVVEITTQLPQYGLSKRAVDDLINANSKLNKEGLVLIVFKPSVQMVDGEDYDYEDEIHYIGSLNGKGKDQTLYLENLMNHSKMNYVTKSAYESMIDE